MDRETTVDLNVLDYLKKKASSMEEEMKESYFTFWEDYFTKQLELYKLYMQEVEVMRTSLETQIAIARHNGDEDALLELNDLYEDFITYKTYADERYEAVLTFSGKVMDLIKRKQEFEGSPEAMLTWSNISDLNETLDDIDSFYKGEVLVKFKELGLIDDDQPGRK